MNEPIWLRIKRWWCGKRGHRVVKEENGDWWCRRCNKLLSTTYSRRRDGSHV